MKFLAIAFLGLLAVSALDGAAIFDTNTISDQYVDTLFDVAAETFNTRRAECLRDGLATVVDDNQEFIDWYRDLRDVLRNARLELVDCEGRQECVREVRTALRDQFRRLRSDFRDLNNGLTVLNELREVLVFCLRGESLDVNVGDITIIQKNEPAIEEEHQEESSVDFFELPAVDEELPAFDEEAFENELPSFDEELPAIEEDIPEFPEFPESDDELPEFPELDDEKLPEFPELDDEELPEFPELDDEKLPEFPEFPEFQELNEELPSVDEEDFEELPEFDEEAFENELPSFDEEFPALDEESFPELPALEEDSPVESEDNEVEVPEIEQ